MDEDKSEETHDAIPFIAAMMLYNSFNDAHKDDQQWIRRNMELLVKKLQKTINLSYLSISFNLTSFKSNHLWNVYENVCDDESLQIELNEIINLHKIPSNTIILSSNLVTKIMETNKKRSVKCKSKLKRCHEWVQNKKGTIGIFYDNKKGPIITVHYVHKCSKSNCNCIYYHNHYFIDGSLTLESIDSCQQMNSKATFFDDNLIEEAIHLAVKSLSPSSTAENYNQRFEDEINDIQSYLISTNQKIGNRGHDPSLCVNRLREAMMFRGLHITLESELKIDNITIENELIEKYRERKKSKLLSSELKGDRELNGKWLSCTDYARILYDKYKRILQTAGMDFLKWVPVKNGKILLKHFILVGDVAVGINIASCGYPKKMYQHDNQHLQSEMSIEIFQRMCCHESPQRGNGSSYTFATCQNHTTKLNQLGLPAKKINQFCLWNRVQEQIQSHLKKHTEEKQNQRLKETKLEIKTNSFDKDDLKMFKDVMNKSLSIVTRPRRSNYQQTLSNINESLQWENDETKLSSLEDFLQQNNVDAAILDKPEC